MFEKLRAYYYIYVADTVEKVTDPIKGGFVIYYLQMNKLISFMEI